MHIGVKVVFIKKQFEEVRAGVSCSKATVSGCVSWSKLFCGGFFGSDECLCFVKVGNYPSTEVKHSILYLVAWFCEKLVCVCV